MLDSSLSLESDSVSLLDESLVESLSDDEVDEVLEELLLLLLVLTARRRFDFLLLRCFFCFLDKSDDLLLALIFGSLCFLLFLLRFLCRSVFVCFVATVLLLLLLRLLLLMCLLLLLLLFFLSGFVAAAATGAISPSAFSSWARSSVNGVK